MTLIVHSGTAAIDLSPPNTGKSERVWDGMTVPNIASLADTQKDWVYENGLLKPPPPQQVVSFPGFFNPHPLVASTASFGWGYQTFIAPRPYVPPAPLPVEKREMPVVGFRAWGCSQSFKLGWGRKSRLKSTGVAGEWSAGVNTAKCIHNSHVAPDEHCACGFYVLTDLDEVDKHVGMNDGVVVGAVMGWGRVIQHGTEGWRTQYARIVGLLDAKFSKQQDKVTREVAQQYDLEVYSRDALETYVREWGDPLAA